MDLKDTYLQTVKCAEDLIKELRWPDLDTAISFTLSADSGNSTRHAAYILLPVLAHAQVGGMPGNVITLSASWAVYLTAFAIFDDLADQDHPGRPWASWRFERAINTGLGLLFAAQTALARLGCTPDVYHNITRSVGKALMLTAYGQAHPPTTLSLNAYFQYITTKSALHMAEFVRVGAYLATTNPIFLSAMFDYGLSLGLSAQIANDLRRTDWRTDLRSGLPTLPLLCGLYLVDHVDHPRLKEIADKFGAWNEVEIETICTLLREMRVEDYCVRMADAYLSKADAALSRLPEGDATVYLRFLIGREA